MELRIFTEPQEGATYDDQLAVARLAEELGFDAYFRSDHYISFFGDDGLPGPTDAWITLAGLAARRASAARHSGLAGDVPFAGPARHRGGAGRRHERRSHRARPRRRLERPEHAAYGIPFPGTGERFDHLEEQLAVITGLWATPEGERFSYSGRHYRIDDSPALPKPVQRPEPPIIIGGFGPTRTPRLAARYAGEFNVAFVNAEQTGAAFGRIRDGVPGGRDGTRTPWSTRPRRRSAAAGTRPSWRAGRRRSAGIWPPSAPTGWSEPRTRSWTGSGRTPELGATRIYLQVLDLHDLDHLELIASEVMPQVR